MPDPIHERRRWFQFRLRALLIALTALGTLCGYVAMNAKIVSARKSLLSEVVRCGGGFWVPTIPSPFKSSPNDTTVYESPVAEIGFVPGVPHFNGDLTENYLRQRPSTIRRWLGDETIEFIQLPSGTDRKILQQLELAFPEAIVE